MRGSSELVVDRRDSLRVEAVVRLRLPPPPMLELFHPAARVNAGHRISLRFRSSRGPPAYQRWRFAGYSPATSRSRKPLNVVRRSVGSNPPPLRSKIRRAQGGPRSQCSSSDLRSRAGCSIRPDGDGRVPYLSRGSEVRAPDEPGPPWSPSPPGGPRRELAKLSADDYVVKSVAARASAECLRR